MQCLTCGKEIGNELGTCQECRAMRTASTVQSSQEQDGPPNLVTRIFGDNLRTISITVGLLLTAVFTCVFAWTAMRPPVLVVQQTSDGVTVETKGSGIQIHYTKGRAVHGTLRVIGNPTIDKSLTKLTGISAMVALISEDEYQTMLKKYRNVGACPASFLNSHMRQYFLIGNSTQSAGSLRSLSLKEGALLTLQGEIVNYVSLTEDGKLNPYMTAPRLSGEILFVESYSVANR